MAKNTRGCRFSIHYEAQLRNNAGMPKKDTIYMGTASSSVVGLSAQRFTVARRNSRKKIESCGFALWATGQLNKKPQANCAGVEIDPKATTLVQDIVNRAYTSLGYPQKPVDIEVFLTTSGDKGCGGGSDESRTIRLGKIEIDVTQDPPVTVDGERSTRFFIPVLPEDQGELPVEGNKNPPGQVNKIEVKPTPHRRANGGQKKRRNDWSKIRRSKRSVLGLRKKGTVSAISHNSENTYLIAPNDTLSEIAKRFGTTVNELVKINQIKDPDIIHVGQTLTLPG